MTVTKGSVQDQQGSESVHSDPKTKPKYVEKYTKYKQWEVTTRNLLLAGLRVKRIRCVRVKMYRMTVAGRRVTLRRSVGWLVPTVHWNTTYRTVATYCNQPHTDSEVGGHPAWPPHTFPRTPTDDDITRRGATSYNACNKTISNTIRYDTWCYFNVRSKTDVSQLNPPHGTDN